MRMLSKTSCCKRLWTRPQWAPSSRQASTATRQGTQKFPFPSHRHPSPHQIFHLPKNASENDIKARYFDLVRIYHPDKAGPSVSPDTAHARFQAITAAYDALRGKTPLAASPTSTQDSRYPTTAAWRARSRREELYSGGDERWKDRIILAGLVATFTIVVAQVFSTRRQALAEAAARSRHPQTSAERNAALEANDSDNRLNG